MNHPARAPAWWRRFPAAFDDSGALARALVVHAPRKCVVALLLLLVAGVTEAFGLLLIVPLLHAVGFSAQPGKESSIAEKLASAADFVGVELTLSVVLSIFLVLAAVRAAVAWQRSVLLTELRMEFTDRLREKFYMAVAGAKWEFLLGRRRSDVQHVLTGDINRIGQSAFLLLQLAARALLALAQIALVMVIAPLLTLSILAAGAVLLFFTRSLVQRSRTLGEKLTADNRSVYGSMTDFLGGLKLAKSFNAEGRHVRHFTEAVAAMRERQLAFTRISSATRVGLDMGAAIALAALAWLALSTASLPLPELLLIAMIFARLLPVLFRSQQDAQSLAHMLPAYASAQSMQRALQEAAEVPAGRDGSRIGLRTALTVRDVSFAYESGAETEPRSGTVRSALKNVSMDVPAGKMTAIAGPSAAGKSTLVDVLLGLLAPRTGEVRVDGVPLTGSNSRRWRRSVACVPQDPYLFHDTIRANLRWAVPEATEADMWQALRLAAADRFVAALPDGLDAVAGDRGGRLSGGERQRIALARALMSKPDLLVLDEATAQLDADNERRILEALQSLRGHTTIVAIAHRPALLEAADGIVLLESGRVAAIGAWRELAAKIMAVEGATNGHTWQ